jgi:hypothetical protein
VVNSKLLKDFSTKALFAKTRFYGNEFKGTVVVLLTFIQAIKSKSEPKISAFNQSLYFCIKQTTEKNF